MNYSNLSKLEKLSRIKNKDRIKWIYKPNFDLQFSLKFFINGKQHEETFHCSSYTENFNSILATRKNGSGGNLVLIKLSHEQNQAHYRIARTQQNKNTLAHILPVGTNAGKILKELASRIVASKFDCLEILV